MKRVLNTLFMLLLCFSAYSQEERPAEGGAEQKIEKIEIYFDLNSCGVDSTYMNNGSSVQVLLDSFNALSTNPNAEITEVAIYSYSSPVGDLRYNVKLAAKRTEVISQYLIESCSIPKSLIVANNMGIAWDLMREYILASDADYKTAVVDIIDNVPVETWRRVNPTDKWQTMVDSRNKHLMQLQYGDPYRHMQTHIFPRLRKSSIEIIYTLREEEPVVEVAPEPIAEVEPATIVEEEEIVEEIAEAEEIIEVEEVIEPEEVAEVVEVAEVAKVVKIKKEKLPRNPILAVKTNLIGLGAGVANAEVEVPLRDNFTITGSAYYSPYTIDTEWKIRVSILQPELRYYLSNPLEKHYFGAHAHVGQFNISTNQWSRYQSNPDEPLWGFGLSYGYALYLSRAWSLEFNIGAGYASLCYDSFYNVENGALYNSTHRGYWGVT